MMISVSFLSVLVTIALLVAAVAPAALLAFFVRDWRNGNIW